jgi:hypothetical protein
MIALALNQGMAQETAVPQNPTKTSQRTKQMPFRGTIAKIDLKAMTLTLGGKEKERTFVLTAQTKIKKAGEIVKLEEVRTGDKVGGLARANGDKWEVVTLNVGEKPDKAAAKKATKSKDI